MDALELEKMRLKLKHQSGNKEINFKKNINQKLPKQFVSRILLAVIFVLLGAIYINLSDETKRIFKENVFETTLSFTKINEWYETKFGSSLPIDVPSMSVSVGSEMDSYVNVSDYHEGVKITTTKDSAINSLNSGIVVFVGEKDNYGNVVIIQGIDGVDIWYGNITNLNVSLYDYVEKNTILGSANADHIYFVFQKDGSYLDYEEYKNQI